MFVVWLRRTQQFTQTGEAELCILMNFTGTVGLISAPAHATF